MEKTAYQALFSGLNFAIVLTASVVVIAICATLGWSLGCRLPGQSPLASPILRGVTL